MKSSPTPTAAPTATTTEETPTPAATPRVYFPHLDGLRFWAFFAVLIAHSFVSHNPTIEAAPLYQFLTYWKIAGTLGVNFFFVLSGFLITYLLLVEQQKRGTIDVRAFWMRRALRIWPLYFACVAATYLLHPARVPGDPTPPIGYFLSFLPNFLPAPETVLANGHTYYYGPLSVLWSVGVEEQFYVVWPLLFVAFVTHRIVRQPQWLFGGLCVFSLVFSLLNHGDQNLLYRHTGSLVGTLALGGWAAWHCFFNPRFVQWIETLSRRFIVGVYLALLIAIVVYVRGFENGWVFSLERPILGALFAFVIVEQCYATNSFYKCGRQRWLSALGRYTYGLYCLQFFAIIIVEKLLLRVGNPASLWQLVFAQTFLALAVDIVLAMLSFHLLEQPFLRLKRRFSHVQTR